MIDTKTPADTPQPLSPPGTWKSSRYATTPGGSRPRLPSPPSSDWPAPSPGTGTCAGTSSATTSSPTSSSPDWPPPCG
ncbi:hypothetical protein ACFQ60_01230 [Streptomyces zhihengii]